MKKRVLMVILSTMIFIGMSGCVEAKKNTDVIVTIGKQNVKCITFEKTGLILLTTIRIHLNMHLNRMI